MSKEFGDLLLRYRSSQIKRGDLAKKISKSVSYLSLIETGKRTPQRSVINDLADSLKLSFAQRNELLTAAGYEKVPSAPPDLMKEFRRMLAGPDLDSREANLLLRDLREFANRWTKYRKARAGGIKKAVIVAAGWQSRLLAPDKLEATILHAAQEALEAEITEVILVIAPTKSIPKFDQVRNLKGITKISVVIQEEPSGLGHAILCARSDVEAEPFAVILPVDVDEKKTAIKEMKERYLKVKKPMLAVNPEPTAAEAVGFKYYGCAVLDGPVKDENGQYVDQLNYIEGLQEKRRDSTTGDLNPNARMIVGRYILTPDIFEVLDLKKLNAQTQKIELTDALETFRLTHHHVCAYTIDRDLLPLAPMRAFLDILIDSINQPERIKHMVLVVKEALAKVEEG